MGSKLNELEDQVTNLTLARIGCNDYNVLNDSRRKTTFFSKSDWSCDNANKGYRLSPDWKGEGWYRVVGPAGTKLADSPIDLNHCGSAGPRYVQGSHPILIGEIITTKACYKQSSICTSPQDVKIRNCVKYFLYYLPETQSCWQGYCTV